MWYDLIPRCAIVWGGLALPGPCIWYFYKIFHKGNPYRRVVRTEWQQNMYRRDETLSGNVYVQKGLENLPSN